MLELLTLLTNKVKAIAYKIGLIADYVVEQNATGKLNYRKWNSGLIEAWYTEFTSIGTLMATSFMGGYLFYKEIQDIPNGLFKTMDSISVNGRMGTGVGWGLGVSYSMTHVRIYVCGNQNDTNMTVHSCEIRGRWK